MAFLLMADLNRNLTWSYSISFYNEFVTLNVECIKRFLSFTRNKSGYLSNNYFYKVSL